MTQLKHQVELYERKESKQTRPQSSRLHQNQNNKNMNNENIELRAELNNKQEEID